MKPKIKPKVGHYIILAVMALIAAVMIVADCLCYANAQAITNLLCGRGINFEGENVDLAMAESDALVRKISEEGIVLLKNEGGKDGKGILPLEENNRKLNLFGWSASDEGFLLGGFGSGGVQINPTKRVTLRQGLEEQDFAINTALLDKYAEYKASRDPNGVGKRALSLVEPGREWYSQSLIDDAKAFSDTAVIVIARDGGENTEIPEYQEKYNFKTDTTRTYLQVSTEEEALIDLVTENFDKVIVLIDCANPMELGFLDNDRIDAALNVGFCGQSGTTAIGKILKGEVNPSGRTVDTYAYDWRSAPSFANKFKNGDDATYTEGIYIGYKWYETAFADKVRIEAYGKTFDYSTEEGYRAVVKYPFGYGLSYTSFSWALESAKVKAGDEEVDLADARINNKKATVEVNVAVTNTGDRAGKDVVQLYYSAPYTPNGTEKAAVVLADFEKTTLLDPGQTEIVTLSFDLYDMASYDCYDRNGNGTAAYELDAGTYRISLRNNAHDVNVCPDGTVEFSLPESITYKRDPKTKRIVKNRFTGESAYGGVPIDGQTVGEEIVYLKRANAANTFPVSATPQRVSGDVNTAYRYVYTGYDGVAPAVKQGQEGSLRIWTREDGSDATAKDLQGTGEALKLNEELVLKLGSDYKAGEYEQLLDQITIDELFNLVESSGYATDEMVSIGKAINRDPDGPSGFLADYGAIVDASKWTAFTSETMIAATFNKAIAFQFGRAMGNEGAETALSGWYAPAANLHRTPYNGRYFEYFSEDGLLSGYMAAYTIKGAASANMYCYLKHLALSEMGINPVGVNVWITEQALRETYLRPFEIAVKDGGANAMMSAFNNIGATWAGGNKALLTDILRNEWGFRGTVITDWSNGTSTMPPNQGIRAGNDIWLNPNDSVDRPLNRGDATDIYLARNSAHNMLYTICNTYYRYTQYDPADGEFAANVGIRNVDDVFPWWVPVLVVLNVLVFGIVIFEVVYIVLKGVKRYKLACVAAENGTTLAEVEAERREKKKRNRKHGTATETEFETSPIRTGRDLSEAKDEEMWELQEAANDGNEAGAPSPAAEVAGAENPVVLPLESEHVAAEQSLNLLSENERLKAEVEKLKEELKAASEEKVQTPKRKTSGGQKATAAKRKTPSAKPKDAKTPSQKQQIAEMQKQIDELKQRMDGKP